MVSDQLDSILKDFESFFKCPLQADKNNSCLIKMAAGVTLQMELNRFGQILIASPITVLPGGRFQDDVLKEAMKANGFYRPYSGIFGLSTKSNTLFLYLLLEPHRLNEDKINQLLPPFIDKAKKWTDALEKGELPFIEEITGSPAEKLPFGFKR
jgi:hypothetical protein